MPNKIGSSRFRTAWVCLLLLAAQSSATVMTSYSYRQLDSEFIFENSVGPTPLPSLVATEQPLGGDATYQFDVSATSGPAQLSGRASLNASIDQTGRLANALWNSVIATAEAVSTFDEIATVQGVGGIPEGTVVIGWTVAGTTELSLRTTGDVQVENISNTARLESNIPDHEGVVFEHVLVSPFQGAVVSNASSDTSESITSGTLEFNVPWTAGTEIPLHFDLTLGAIAHLTNVNAYVAESGLDLDLSNTAELSVIDIQDGGGASIPGAELVFQSGDPLVDVLIDIKPDDDSNIFNNNGKGVLPVAVFGSQDFDVTLIDLDSVRLEDTLAIKSVGANGKLLAHLEDVNDDMFTDYLLQLEDVDDVFEVGETMTTLTGRLLDGTLFAGTDFVTIVPATNTSAVPEPSAIVILAMATGWLLLGRTGLGFN